MEVAIPVISLFLLLIIGVPVAFSLAIAGSMGVMFNHSFVGMLGILQSTPHESAAKFVLITIPMFILMAEVSSSGGITQKAFSAGHKWLGHFRGGLAMATIVASVGLAAISGSSTASAAAMAKTAVPQMRKYNYSERLAMGVVCIGGTMSMMIPPSITLILYGILTDTGIGALLIAGIIPGILTAIGYAITIYIWVKVKPSESPVTAKFSMKERVSSLKGIWPMLLLITLIMAAIYSGAVTPTEAGAIGAFFATIIAISIAGFKKANIKEALSNTLNTTCMIFTIIIGAMIFGYFLTVSQVTQNLVDMVNGLPLPPLAIMAILMVIILLLGTVMDQLAILFLVVPLTFPIVMSLGFDPIWYGIILAKTAEIGMVTPPLGLNVFVAAKSINASISESFKGASIMIIADLVFLIFLFLFPVLATWLPSLMQ